MPEFTGPLPPREEDDYARFALHTMLLFKPWTSIETFLGDAQSGEDVVRTYEEWHKELRGHDAARAGRRPKDLPSAEGFAYLALMKIENIRLLTLRRNEVGVEGDLPRLAEQEVCRNAPGLDRALCRGRRD